MNSEMMQLVMIRGAIASGTPEEQQQIHQHAERLRSMLRESGETGFVALALVGAEIAAEEFK